jgi:predicted GNAT family acetyltransferase
VIFSEGRKTACLYTDLRNPASNRCYAKLGFRPVCESWHMVRHATPGHANLCEVRE